MKQLRILALSSSRVGNGAYLERAVPIIKTFLGNSQQDIAFIPFASVDDNEVYADKVRESLGTLSHTILAVTPANAKEVIESCDVIMVGGGNTFKLLHDLYQLDLVEIIKAKAHNGTPYIGWSAGSNLTGPTICTTNDMPIIEPRSFNSFGFFPFQLNPHYHNIVMEGFHGETRDQRLEEYLKMNSQSTVVCLPEGTALKLEKGVVEFIGDMPGVVMTNENDKLVRKEINAGTDLSFQILF